MVEKPERFSTIQRFHGRDNGWAQILTGLDFVAGLVRAVRFDSKGKNVENSIGEVKIISRPGPKFRKVWSKTCFRAESGAIRSLSAIFVGDKRLSVVTYIMVGADWLILAGRFETLVNRAVFTVNQSPLKPTELGNRSRALLDAKPAHSQPLKFKYITN